MDNYTSPKSCAVVQRASNKRCFGVKGIERNRELRAKKLRKTLTISGYNVISCLGEGRRGSCFQAMDMLQERLHSVHIVPYSASQEATALAHEAKSLQAHKHRNILRFHHTRVVGNCYILATEYCAKGSAADMCALTTDGLGEFAALRIFRGVLRALRFLHRRDVIHGGVRPHNILMTVEGIPRLCGFKVVGAHQLEGQQPRNPNKDTNAEEMYADYAAPEQIGKRTLGLTKATDMWAAGLTLYALLTRVKHFDKLAWFSAVADSIAVDLDPGFVDSRLAATSPACRTLLRGLLQPEPRRRLSTDMALDLCEFAFARCGK